MKKNLFLILLLEVFLIAGSGGSAVTVMRLSCSTDRSCADLPTCGWPTIWLWEGGSLITSAGTSGKGRLTFA